MTDVHSCSYYCDRPECIKAQRDELRERLAQPEQEPVIKWDVSSPLVVTPHPAFQAAPPQRKPLTDEEIDKIYETKVWDARRSFARAIEAAHGIKGEA